MNTFVVRHELMHAVTAFDRSQEERAAKSKRGYHNAYALAQYLARVDDIMADIEAGAAVDAAICAGFTPGPLRNACLRALGCAKNNAESSGSYKGMPVYQPVAKK